MEFRGRAMQSHEAEKLLEAAYDNLGYYEGDLQETKIDPLAFSLEDWITKGAWLSLGKKVGIERILFVSGNPVIVFARLDTDDSEILRSIYNDIWCMARPRLLFLAKPGELAVYDLSETPVKSSSEWQSRAALDLVHDVREVAEKLRAYRIEQLENGLLFRDRRFGSLEYRADKSLIRDLKIVRAALVEKGLGGNNLKHAHALIGRSLFIRYLEDRNILTTEYFYNVARSGKDWEQLLDKKPEKPDIDPRMEQLLYPRVLSSKDFTYALFTKLAEDFNGDMFPESEEEQSIVTQEHLTLLQGFLRGDTSIQKKLFFYAYRFNIIPIELISNIYEEFYQAENGKQKTQASYYTPPALVEFMLSHVLTSDRLKNNPKIIDPACGSGIFLVEAFKRIVRYHSHVGKQQLKFQNLVAILREQIAGVDINSEAIQVTAFSLYLAMLDFIEPPDILNHIKKGDTLPHLIASESKGESSSLNNLLVANAFEANGEIHKPIYNRFSNGSADIVIGNPPWGNPNRQDEVALQANAVALNWCVEHGYPVGDKERSQTFLWKAKDLLRPDGSCALLVSTGVLFKHSQKSVNFRKMLLSSVTIESIYNFAHTRKFFFKESNSPFAIIVFKNAPAGTDHLIHYWSAKATSNVQSLQAVMLNKSDLKLIKHSDAIRNDTIWKIYWWGSHQDEALIKYISMFDRLKKFTKRGMFGRGFDASSEKMDADWLQDYQSLPTDKFHRYGPLDLESLEAVPKKVNRRGNKEIYSGRRLLIKRGIEERKSPKGMIIARIENEEFCFRNSIHGIKLTTDEDWRYKTVLGILWSSIARYYYFLTSSSWGIWHHDIHVDELLNLPVRFPEDENLRGELLEIVDRLRNSYPVDSMLLDNKFISKGDRPINLIDLEHRLDEVIFKLYELSEAEKDLVRDLCNIGIEYYYGGSNSKASQQVVTEKQNGRDMINEYVDAFLEIWSRQLDAEDEFDWRIFAPSGKGMVAAVFEVKKKSDVSRGQIIFSSDNWNQILQNEFFSTPYYSHNIYLDGIARIVTDSEIIIIKRNERRFWTRSMAREDAEATLVQAMNRESFLRGSM